MTYTQAKKLLDEIKEGGCYTQKRIIEALRLTGDYQNSFNPELAADMASELVPA